MNPSVAGGNHAAVHVEHQVVRWLAELLGMPAGSGGSLVSGGSAATLTALAVARHRGTARAGLDVRAAGLQGSPARFTVHVGEQTHGCAQKAVELLGLGADCLRVAPSDDAFRLRPDALAAHLDADLMLVTALAPHVGYDTAAAIAKQAHHDGSTLRDAALASGAVTGTDYDRWVDPEAMTRPG